MCHKKVMVYDALLAAGVHILGAMSTWEPMCMLRSESSWRQLKEQQTSPSPQVSYKINHPLHSKQLHRHPSIPSLPSIVTLSKAKDLHIRLVILTEQNEGPAHPACHPEQSEGPCTSDLSIRLTSNLLSTFPIILPRT